VHRLQNQLTDKSEAGISPGIIKGIFFYVNLIRVAPRTMRSSRSADERMSFKEQENATHDPYRFSSTLKVLFGACQKMLPVLISPCH